MIRIHLVCVGKIKEPFYREAVSEYQKRLSRFCDLRICEVEESSLREDGNLQKILESEAAALKKHLKGRVIALCVEGRSRSSPDFAEHLKQLFDRGVSELTFVIGSSNGLAEEIKRGADERLSFSEMTFPHMLMRVILTEQLYRAFMILSNSPYHK